MFLGSKNSLLIFLQSYHVWVTSCHVTSCHVIHVSRFMLRHVTSCHVISRHVISCHVMSRHVTSCHVMSRHVTSCHVMSRHVTSWHVMSRQKSRDGHTTNASLSTDFFHTQLIRVEHAVFVGFPEGCRYHTASAVYDLVLLYIAGLLEPYRE